MSLQTGTSISKRHRMIWIQIKLNIKLQEEILDLNSGFSEEIAQGFDRKKIGKSNKFMKQTKNFRNNEKDFYRQLNAKWLISYKTASGFIWDVLQTVGV